MQELKSQLARLKDNQLADLEHYVERVDKVIESLSAPPSGMTGPDDPDKCPDTEPERQP